MVNFPDLKSPQQRRTSRLPYLMAATGVLLLAALMRLVLFQDLPPGLAQDEVLDADIAQLIRQGQHALFFREGYGHEPLYHYFAAPFAPLLGDNVLAVRLPSIILGLLLIAATMRWLRREFSPLIAVVTGCLLAVSWWPIIFSRIGIRPIMLPLFLVGMAYFWQRRPWLAGLCLGLSLYTYTAARVVFLIPLLFIGYQFVERRLSRWLPGPNPAQSVTRYLPPLLILLLTGLIYLPLGLTLRADPTLQQRVDQLSGPLDALRAGDAGPLWETTQATLGVFSLTGDPRSTYTVPDLPLFDPLTAVFFHLGLLLLIWRWRQPRYALLLIWLLVGLIPSAVTPDAPSIIRLIGVLPVVYLLPALALAKVVLPGARRITYGVWRKSSRLRNTQYAIRIVYLIAFLLVILTWGRTVHYGFVEWPQMEEVRLEKYQTVWLDVARHIREETDGRPLLVTDAFYLPITADSLRRNLGTDPQPRWLQTGPALAGAFVLPWEGNGRLYVPEYAPIPPPLLAAVGLTAEPIYRSPDFPAFAVYDLPTETPIPTNLVGITLGEQMTLIGYELDEGEGERPLQLLTYWQVVAPLPPDLTAFVHLTETGSQPVAQHDG
ncbi:MAG: glycosyltransferase family 39 protein, partial [Chloroflexota bacterium]